jgi:hypothetical protein
VVLGVVATLSNAPAIRSHKSMELKVGKPRKLTPQESMVSAFFRHSISGFSTFHPQLFGNGREPADLVVVVGRALIFVNMHESNAYFENLCAHNMNQARERIDEWKSGKPIRGKNEVMKFHLNWSDIDYIHVVGVIDGRNAACSGHRLSTLMMDPKVCLVTTLTSAVMHRLALLGGGARDLIAVSREIEQLGNISESEALQIVQSRHDRLLSEAMSVVPRLPNRLPPAIVNGKSLSPVEEQRLYIEEMRRAHTEVAPIFADFSWEDVFAIVSHVLGTIANIEWLDVGHISAHLFDTKFKFIVIVSTNAEDLIQATGKTLNYASEWGARFVYTISVVSFGIAPMFAVNPTVGPLAAEIELRECQIPC